MTAGAAETPAPERVRRRKKPRASRSLAPAKRLGFAFCLLLATGGLALGIALQPYGPALPALGALALAALAGAFPLAGLVAALVLLPVADLTAWTGMIWATESDLAVLAVVAGISARFAVSPPPPALDLPPTGTLWLVAALVLLGYALSLAGAPATHGAVLAGFASPFNGLRLAKGAVLGVLLAACLRGVMAQHPAWGTKAVNLGIIGGAVAVAAVALWERIAFVGLTDFATDYRTTAAFWEMHVGGATLDGWLALSLPFALWSLIRARQPLWATGVAAATVLILYATLTTFSRGLFAAAAVQTGILLVLGLGQHPGTTAGKAAGRPLFALAVFLAALAYPAFQVFAAGGYRGLAALLAAGGLAFAAAPALARVAAIPLVIGVLGGGLAGAGLGSLAAAVPKAIYFVFAVFIALGAAAALRLSVAAPSAGLGVLAAAAVSAAALAAPSVTAHWSDAPAPLSAWAGALLALTPLLLCRPAAATRWAPGLPTAVLAAIGLGGLGAAVAVGSSYYAEVRFSTVSEDTGSRLQHWSDGLALIDTPADWLVGIGAGRYPEAYFWKTRGRFLPGSFGRVETAEGPALRLSPASTPVGWGELFRVSQRIDTGAQPPMRLEIRTHLDPAEDEQAPVVLHTEVCRQWLLYNADCLVAQRQIHAGTAVHTIALEGTLGARESWGIPRPAQFALGIESKGRRVDILSVALTDAAGRAMLRNGDFRNATQWWFFSSERAHLPYHAKNLWLHSLIEQGLVGLVAVTLAGVLALLWVTVGPGRRHPLAPPCLAALAGFGIVGVFDSLIDAPRLTVLWLVVTGLALSLRGGTAAPDH